MGLHNLFIEIFHSSKNTAIGMNRPYFLRSVELVKALKGLSRLGPSAQKSLPQLYKELEHLLRNARAASGGKARNDSDERLDRMFDEAIEHVDAFLQKHGDATQLQEFTDKMKKAEQSDCATVGRMRVMCGRVFQMMQKYEKMEKKTFDMFHWVQPDKPSIHASDWVKSCVWSRYDVEGGITVEEFINRILTLMIADKTSRFRDDLLLRNPRLYHDRILDKADFFNIKKRGEIHAPDKMHKILREIKSEELQLVFDFEFGESQSDFGESEFGRLSQTGRLHDLIRQTFDTGSPRFPEWLDRWTNVFWTRCPANDRFEWVDTPPGVRQTCAYKDEEHAGHVIFRDSKGNMEHLLMLPHQVRVEPVVNKSRRSGDESGHYQPTTASHGRVRDNHRARVSTPAVPVLPNRRDVRPEPLAAAKNPHSRQCPVCRGRYRTSDLNANAAGALNTIAGKMHGRENHVSSGWCHSWMQHLLEEDTSESYDRQ